MSAKHITLLGDGGWGTALACLLAGKGHRVALWGNFPEVTEETRRLRENKKFLPGIPLPEDVHPEATQPGKPPRTVQIKEVVDSLPIFLPGDELKGQIPNLLLAQPLLGHGHQLPVNTGPDHVPGLDVDVAGSVCDRRPEDLDHAAGLRMLDVAFTPLENIRRGLRLRPTFRLLGQRFPQVHAHEPPDLTHGYPCNGTGSLGTPSKNL